MNLSALYLAGMLSTYYLMIMVFSTSYFIQEVASGGVTDQFSMLRCS